MQVKKLRIDNFDFLVKMFVIVLAALTPLILYFTQGYHPSISTYWRTPMQPLFIIVNAITSYYLFGIKNWKFPAFFMLMLTAFSVTDFMIFHNIVAGMFFVSCLVAIHISRHLRFIFWMYLISLPVMIYDLLLGESLAVFSLCLYHAIVLIKINKFANR